MTAQYALRNKDIMHRHQAVSNSPSCQEMSHDPHDSYTEAITDTTRLMLASLSARLHVTLAIYPRAHTHLTTTPDQNTGWVWSILDLLPATEHTEGLRFRRRQAAP